MACFLRIAAFLAVYLLPGGETSIWFCLFLCISLLWLVCWACKMSCSHLFPFSDLKIPSSSQATVEALLLILVICVYLGWLEATIGFHAEPLMPVNNLSHLPRFWQNVPTLRQDLSESKLLLLINCTFNMQGCLLLCPQNTPVRKAIINLIFRERERKMGFWCGSFQPCPVDQNLWIIMFSTAS